MRILITNDDGIHAPGLAVLHEIAETVAGPDGEVWTVAPAFEQSGVGHCVSYTKPFLSTQHDDHRYSVDGTPADCVMAALSFFMEGKRPDLVLSGVNRGNNSAENTLYSGTIGAAMEAALQGLPAIALSQYYGPANRDLADPFEASRVHGAALVTRMLDLFDTEKDLPYTRFFNVNFPALPADGVKGAKLVHQGRRIDANFGVVQQASPAGKSFLWVRGGRNTGQRPKAATRM